MPKFHQSHELYDYNLNFIRWLADFAGVDMMVENYRMNYRTCYSIFSILIVGVGIVYSCVFYFPNWFKILEVSLTFAVLMQASIKFYNGYIHRHFFILMYGRIRNFHYKYRNHSNNVQLLQLIERIHLVSKMLSVLYLVSACSFLLYPIYMYWARGKRELMLSVRFPLIDADTLNGYIITTVLQLLATIICIFGLAAADSAILLFVCSLAGFVDVFKNDLNELSTLLLAKCRDEEAIRKKVRMICIQHLDVIEYESNLDERYISTCFFQVISTTVGLSVSLFLVYMEGYLPGYGIMLAMSFQLLEFCLLGTVLTVKNEEITEAIYETHWYLMEPSEQRCFALMLHKSQNFTEMTVGGLAPLNIETFVAIVKSIYSYFMMLISFVES